ncbi:MAG TPA: LuxR C-terminal-related transcriptional regulator [Trebonia sp.]|nr:LuxR C-terminal-related transcriptional regulator [Trebonia sp.]
MRRSPDELHRELTGFVGRSRELDALAETLESARLVTITGTAGVGKTRVALRFAATRTARFADGVCFAELGGLRDSDLVPHTVAACLGLPEQDARTGVDAVVGYLSERQLMLVLDTCEHVITGCVPLVFALLRHAPGVTVLATSRQPLDLPGEHVFPLPPLPVPGPREAAGEGDAVELFAQRAAAAVPGFTVSGANRGDVIRLCRRLDGIPLAIELAAVQLRATSLPALTSGLEHRFLALAGGPRAALPHQQTLRATIRWSYDLCAPAERILWARLSVFAGSFTIPAATSVCAGGTLDDSDVLTALIGLVDKSVVLRPQEPAGQAEPRYRLLDTIREFGAEQLAGSGELAATRDRHIAYFLGLAEEFARRDKDSDQLPRFHALRGEHPNLRAALGYALGTPGTAGNGQLAARLAAALRPYWEISGLLREGRHWTDKILPQLTAPAAERGWLLLTRGVLAILQGELGEATADLEACIALTREGGAELTCALGYTYLCLALVFSGRHAEAAAAGAAAEERLGAAGHVSGLVSLDIHLGYLYLLSGKADKAIERCAQGLRRLDAGERWARSYLQLITALGLFLEGDHEASAAAARESLRLKSEVGDITGIAYCLEMLAFLAAVQDRCKRTAWLLGAADTLWGRTGKRLGGTAEMEGLHQQAASIARDRLGSSQYAKLFGDGAARELSVTIDLAGSDTDRLPVSRGSLTRREQEIAALVFEGLTNAQIARRLVVSSRTVDAHVASIYAKLGVSSRAQLAAHLGQRSGSADRTFS